MVHKGAGLLRRETPETESEESLITHLIVHITTSDEKWRLAVHANSGEKCEICGKQASDAHHLITRGTKCLHRAVENGLSICTYHHNMKHHSGHANFNDELEAKNPERYEDFIKLRNLRNQLVREGVHPKDMIDRGYAIKHQLTPKEPTQ